MTTWAHNCDSTGKFSLIPLNEECKACGINSVVVATRHAGYVASPMAAPKSKETPASKKRIAALFLPFKRTNTNNKDYETEYYDRQG
jgi:anaerobic ribonucleoside-triphosphate reductase